MEILTVLNDVMYPEGNNSLVVAGDELITGVYYLHIEAAGNEIVKEFVVAK